MPTFKIPQEIQALAEPDLDEKEVALLSYDLEDFAERYIQLDDEEKATKKQKEDAKTSLLNQIEEFVELGDAITLDTQKVVASNADLERFDGDVKQWVEFFFPAYRISALTPNPTGIELDLEQSPKFVPYSVVVGDRQVGRTVRMEGAEIDIDGLLSDPGLETLSEEAEEAFAACFKKQVVTTWEIDEKAVIAAVDDYPEIMPIVRRYSYAGKPKVVMTPVSKAKEIDV